MSVIVNILTILGSLGLFLYGMKLMSESLQRVAGNKMRAILASMTSTRVAGVVTGVAITAAIQSSSATTVMVVSFVNAGLLSLSQAISVVMGANIGTTVTAWLISVLGLKVKISVMAIPIIGLCLPLLFSKHKRRRSIGEVVFGFSLLFMGLGFLKENMPDINSNPEILEFLAAYTDLGFLSLLIFVGIGTLLTVIIQSSSATMALTIIMCNNGWISYEMAAAMVLGENVGTTITANIAALIGNTQSKRTARAHTIFNLLGVVWILIVFTPFLTAVDSIINTKEGISAFNTATAVPLALSLFHTCFNVLNTTMLVWFVPHIEKVVVRLTPSKTDEDEEFHLRYIGTGMLSTSELSILQAQKEIAFMGHRIEKMYRNIPKLLSDKASKNYTKYQRKIEKGEDISDRLQLEIANYITKITTEDISNLSSKKIRTMLKIIDELESIGDVCYQIGMHIENKNIKKVWFPKEQKKNLDKMFQLIADAINVMNANLNMDYKDVTIGGANALEIEINTLRDNLKLSPDVDDSGEKFTYEENIIYNDMISLCEKVGDHVINVTEAIYYGGDKEIVS